jgi:hypothetical protein
MNACGAASTAARFTFGPALSAHADGDGGRLNRRDLLGGLIHEYDIAAAA